MNAKPEWCADLPGETPQQKLDRLRSLLASRDHMKTLMRHGKDRYWSWREWATTTVAALEAALGDLPYVITEPVAEPPPPRALKFTNDFEALVSAFNLLHTLSRETDMEPAEAQLVHDLRTYLKSRSEPV